MLFDRRTPPLSQLLSPKFSSTISGLLTALFHQSFVTMLVAVTAVAITAVLLTTPSEIVAPAPTRDEVQKIAIYAALTRPVIVKTVTVPIAPLPAVPSKVMVLVARLIVVFD